MRKLVLACCVFAALASAGTISPTTVINGVDAFSGPSFTLDANAALTDLLNITASGQVFLQTGNTYGTNAAGVITTNGSYGVGQSLACSFGCPGSPNTYGALLIGNTTLGFFQVFPTNAANGLGSLTPPSVLSTSISLQSLGFAAPLPAGTVLEFRIADSGVDDNSGSFTVAGSVGTPEPVTFALAGAGIAAILFLRRRAA